MLNPSIADASIDDPTIRRCMSFARRENYGGIIVANLFAFRATSPQGMMSAEDPFGPQGSEYIKRQMMAAKVYNTPILAAWGTLGNYLDRADAVKLSAKGWGVSLVCLGMTADGHPRHPLYVRGDQPIIPLL